MLVLAPHHQRPADLGHKDRRTPAATRRHAEYENRKDTLRWQPGIQHVPSPSNPDYWSAAGTAPAASYRVLRHQARSGRFTVLRLRPGINRDPTVGVVDSFDQARQLIHQLTRPPQPPETCHGR